MTMIPNAVDVATVRQWLGGGGEVAFLDVREEGQHGAGHPLLAVNVPYSRLELIVGQLVPRHACRVVLLDDGDGVADKAARRLGSRGYTAVHVLEGGVAAWSTAGRPLFPSTNVPSKAFAELVEHDFGTPAITAAELDRRRRAGENIIVLDSRPADEYARFHVPGAITCPGAELVLRVADLVPDPRATIVVSCAGRTRGIIGAQSLRTAGVPNPVLSLEGGTQAWRLAGLDLEYGPTTSLKPASPQALAAARQRAESVAARFGIRRIDRASTGAARCAGDHGDRGGALDRCRRGRRRGRAERGIPQSASRGCGLDHPSAARPFAGQCAARDPHRRICRRRSGGSAGGDGSRGDR